MYKNRNKMPNIAGYNTEEIAVRGYGEDIVVLKNLEIDALAAEVCSVLGIAM